MKLKETDKLAILKDILFTDDKEYITAITKRIQLLEEVINEQEKLSSKVDPIILDQLDKFTKSIPEKLGPTITATLKREIKNSRDDVVEALYPILGKMVKKYVAQEIKMLSEKMDDQFSFLKGMGRRFSYVFKGEEEKKRLLNDLSGTKIEQVLLIQKDSGILEGSYSVSNTIDEEMISGMLTAIKSFVEDAFHQKNQDLELIEYELYHIHIQSFISYYVVVVVSGNYTTRAKNKIQDLIFDFYEKFLEMNLDLVYTSKHLEKEVSKLTPETIDLNMERHFGNAKI